MLKIRFLLLLIFSALIFVFIFKFRPVEIFALSPSEQASIQDMLKQLNSLDSQLNAIEQKNQESDQSKIRALLNQLENLSAQLKTITQKPVSPAAQVKSADGVKIFPFERDLYFGLRNDPDVVNLQNFLRVQGYFNYAESTGNFLSATLDAVKKFQEANNIQPIAGYFGSASRAKANQIISSSPAISSATPPASPSATSTYYGQIRISSVSGNSSVPEDEMISISNYGSSKSVDITGWTIENSRANSFIIPRVYNIPALNYSYLDNLILPPYGEVIIDVGRQNKGINFRENLCTGYFDQYYSFRPSISHECPRPDTRNLTYLDDNCLSIIDQTSSCRVPEVNILMSDACSQYVNANLNYAGCVNNYRGRSDFFKNRWFIWMQRREEFLKNTHDTVILKDQFGKIVDRYSY